MKLIKLFLYVFKRVTAYFLAKLCKAATKGSCFYKLLSYESSFNILNLPSDLSVIAWAVQIIWFFYFSNTTTGMKEIWEKRNEIVNEIVKLFKWPLKKFKTTTELFFRTKAFYNQNFCLFIYNKYTFTYIRDVVKNLSKYLRWRILQY